MDPFKYPPANSGLDQQKKPTSVFRAMLPRNQKPSPAGGASASPTKLTSMRPPALRSSKTSPILPPDHPYVSLPLGEVNQNRERTRSSPACPQDVYSNGREKSAVDGENRQPCGKYQGSVLEGKDESSETDNKLKKSKSSTSFPAFLARPKSSKNLKLQGQHQQKDKENRAPPNSADGNPPPIWAQFASAQKVDLGLSQKVSLNDRQNIRDEVALYTPNEYSPSKGRNFQNELPTLSSKASSRARPTSAYLPSSKSSTSFAETISGLRKLSRKQNKESPLDTEGQDDDIFSCRRSSTELRKISNDSSQSGLTMTKRGSRVMAAVAKLNNNAKEPIVESKAEQMNPEAVESAFEALLESRNAEPNVREKMRTLDTNIKADFIRQHNTGSAFTVAGTPVEPVCTSRPSTAKIPKSESKTFRKGPSAHAINEPESHKKSRPRSLTFTISKGNHSFGRKKGERLALHERTKSASIVPSASASSLASPGLSQSLGHLLNPSKQSVPEDFVKYLRKVQRPQYVEVGRLQKLRQLLRNETVSWVNSFIVQGGMVEIVGLLYRIIDIEWREEHEDTLLHHTLMCLKALFTTSLALSQLDDIQRSLFPTLLRLLFSAGEEKKGPAEFSTRGIIISLLFIYISNRPAHETAARAYTILSYLRDPVPKEEERPPGFIDQMRTARPYKIWCKEVSDVTKEVFWIFLHHLNVIPYPPLPDSSASYQIAHYPKARPPVAAAPYVGGVEWEATTYLATHLDLLNGLIASLPTLEERNSLRTELRDSGFEKVMGGSLRTCKEKFYGGVHAGLITWVGAAREDGWACSEVREGPKRDEVRARARSSPKKKDLAPKLEVSKLEVGELKLEVGGFTDDGWM
ncbi:hypothetical protein MMC26_003692 [Xylographa opegraphella]|nr:hypothetical protein [Xylographa opegraphella]